MCTTFFVQLPVRLFQLLEMYDMFPIAVVNHTTPTNGKPPLVYSPIYCTISRHLCVSLNALGGNRTSASSVRGRGNAAGMGHTKHFLNGTNWSLWYETFNRGIMYR